jgi:hypothetical protein
MGTASLIASLLAAVIQGVPQISAQIKAIILAISSSLGAVVASGVTSSVNPNTVLAALAGVITALKALPNLPQATLQVILDLEASTVAALAADQVAQQKVDPTQLLPITPVA